MVPRYSRGSRKYSGNETNQESKAGESKISRPRAATLIYCPLHLGGPHAGVSLGPAAMKVARLMSRVKELGFEIKEEIEIKVPDVLTWWEHCHVEHQGRCVPEIRDVSQQVAQAVERALANDTIAITIGGDHSLAIGSIAGASSYYRKLEQEFGLFWFDAHGDINTPDTSPSGNVHGMPFAVSLGNGDPRLTGLLGYSPKILPHRCSLIGIRDLDKAEEELVRESGVLPFTMRDVDELGIVNIMNESLAYITGDAHCQISGLHVSFDLDVIDPEVAPGVSTFSAGGLTYRESHHALELLADTGLVRSIDIVELNPARDLVNKTAELAVELVRSALGKNIL